VLITGPLTVLPVLYMADGTQYSLQPVQVPTAGTAQINVNDALSYAPPAIEPHLSAEYGSAALYYQYKNPGHLLGLMEIINLQGSLIFTTVFDGLDAGAAGTQTLEAAWWRHNPQVGGFVALSNVTSSPIQVSLQPAGSLGTRVASTAITLQGHATQMLDLDSLAADLPQAENQAGGLRLQYYGKKGTLMANGGLVNEGIGYSTDIPFWSHDLDPTSAPVPITYACVGFMVGQPQAGMGFPASVRFTPYAVLKNTTAQPITVTPTLNYMPAGSPVTLPLPVQQLKPEETRQLDLPSMLASLGLGTLNGDINLSFSITGHGGDLVIATGSVDQTGNYVFPVPPDAIGKSFAKGIGYWTVANGQDTMYSLWNPTNTDQDFVVTLHYGDGSGQYVLPVHLAAQASTTIDIGMLIAMGQPDANGNLIPSYVQEGGAVVSNSKGPAEWMTVAVCAAFYNPRKATCGGVYCVMCEGFAGPEVLANPFSVAVTGTVQLHAKATFADGTVYEFTTNSSWSSSNTAVATVGASTGLVTGVSGGSAQIGAQFPFLPDVTGQQCAETGGLSCPEAVYYPVSPGSADSATISGAQQRVDGVNTASFSVTAGGDTPTSYAWSFTAPQGAGNSPNVNFNPSNQASTTTDAHWFALPNGACTASGNAAYTIVATVTFPGSVQIAPQTTLTVMLLVTAGYEGPAFVSGLPSIAQNSQGVWVVTGTGSLTRNVANPVVYYPTSSQFYNKVSAHENEHYQQWTTGMLSDLYVVSNLYAQLAPLTATTQVGLQNEINSAISTWNAGQASILASRLPAAEAQAYQVSDPIAPLYYYQSACGAGGL
jgi:hypothetical protein